MRGKIQSFDDATLSQLPPSLLLLLIAPNSIRNLPKDSASNLKSFCKRSALGDHDEISQFSEVFRFLEARSSGDVDSWGIEETAS